MANLFFALFNLLIAILIIASTGNTFNGIPSGILAVIFAALGLIESTSHKG